MAAMAETEQDFTAKATQVYRDLAALPYLTKGKIVTHKCSSSLTVVSQWTQRDLIKNENRNFQRQHYLKLDVDPKDALDSAEPVHPAELLNVQMMSTSPSQQYQIIIRKYTASPSKEEKDKQFIEVWSHNNMVRSVDVKSADKHGSIFTDSQFGSLKWSTSEKYALYVAEKKKPKAISHFDINKEDKETAQQPIKGDQFVSETDWGEQLEGKYHPVLVVLTVETGDMRVLDNTPKDLSVGQALWAPCDEGIVFCGWRHTPYRLGLTYCTNRSCGIFYIGLDGTNFRQLSEDDLLTTAGIHPSFNPQMDKMVYLSRSVRGGHLTSMKLMMYDWKDNSTKTIVDVVDDPKDDAFPGLYKMTKAERCWSSDGSRFLVSSMWRSSQHILCIDVNSKSVTRITKDAGSWELLDVYNDYILASFSTPTRPHQLVIAHLPSEVNNETNFKWTTIAASSTTDENFTDLQWSILSFPSLAKDEGFNGSYESVLVRPVTDRTDVPLIVFPHGGPHTVFPSSYMTMIAGMAKLGFALLVVNYKGSIGFGKKSQESLLGKIGSQDIAEVKAAADYVLSQGGYDRNNVFLTGGSHGGFISIHLIGQYPDMFRACSVRNPVTNLPAMLSTTDIPDWVFEESGLEFYPHLLSDSNQLATLLSKSPISHAHKIITPTLICLGDVDRRVHPTQGKHLYRTLKSRGIETRLLVYPDNNHPLSKVDAESDVFMNTVCWFYKHLARS